MAARPSWPQRPPANALRLECYQAKARGNPTAKIEIDVRLKAERSIRRALA